MNTEKQFEEITIKKKNMNLRAGIFCILFILMPVIGFSYFQLNYEVLKDQYFLLFLGILILFSVAGLSLIWDLRKDIRRVSKNITETLSSELEDENIEAGAYGLYTLVNCFKTIKNHLDDASHRFERKVYEISILKELSEQCYVTFDPDELLHVTLERALRLVNADIGSIMILEKPNRQHFVIKASFGHGDKVKLGARVDFSTSIAKHAVINKAPLVMGDVEKDSLIGRANNPKYGTKSFICMPLKTINDILGVLTISRKNDSTPFSQKDADILTPLLSTGASAYENLRLMKENDRRSFYLKAMARFFKLTNSSFRDSELLHTILDDIQSVVPYNMALIMVTDENKGDVIKVLDVLSSSAINVSKGSVYSCRGSIIDKVLKQDKTLIVNDTERLSAEIEKELLVHENCRSCILVPLKMNSHVAGSLVLGADAPDMFYESKEFLERVADGLSLAIERDVLSSSVIKRNQELDTIKQIGSALASSTFDIQQVLQYTMDMIRVIMNVETGSLLLVEGDALEFKTAFNMDLESVKNLRIKLGQGIAGYVAARGETVIENDVQKSSMFYSSVDDRTGFLTKSVMCVPMISQGKVAGVIEVLNKIDGDFSSNDKHLLQSIASTVSIAIENARLYRETVSMAEHERGIRRMFQKFVPKEVVDKIIHGAESDKVIMEEFRTLTLLNIDIRGFSILSKELGPQKTVLILNYFFSIMGSIVFKYGGIVDKYLGDGFLAIFGAPVAGVADADNAVMAALEMRQSVMEVNNYFQAEIGTSITTGISVHTGEVVIGNIGFEKKMDYTVIGDSVNAVFRLQSLTKPLPNGILISEKTVQASRSRLDVCEFGKSDIYPTLKELRIYELKGRLSN